MFSSALFQIGYGSLLMISPERISVTVDIGDLISNEQVRLLVFMYGRLFIPVALSSALTAVLIIKNSAFGMIFASVSAATMINAGVGSFVMTGSIAYLIADLFRGLFILMLVILYYFKYYRKIKVAG
jgi:hypothetical protein